jgi:hypothetical protein
VRDENNGAAWSAYMREQAQPRPLPPGLDAPRETARPAAYLAGDLKGSTDWLR